MSRRPGRVRGGLGGRYLRLADVGVLRPSERVELIDGQIVAIPVSRLRPGQRLRVRVH